MADDNRTYWLKRQAELAAQVEKDEKKLRERLARIYKKEAKELDGKIAAFYQQYGKDGFIEYRELMRTADEATRNQIYTAWEQYIQEHPEHAHLTPMREKAYVINRLEAQQYDMLLQQVRIGDLEAEEITKHLTRIAERGIKSSAELMGGSFNVPAQIEFAGAATTSAGDFSARIWEDAAAQIVPGFEQRIFDNRIKLANYINNDLSRGYARGDAYARLTKQVTDRFTHVSTRDAYRLVYTEGTRVMAESSSLPLRTEFEQYEIVTAGDHRVCPDCEGLEGQVFRFADRMPGTNFPPLHPWCRCTFEVHVDDWNQWIDDYVARHGGDNLTPARIAANEIAEKFSR